MYTIHPQQGKALFAKAHEEPHRPPIWTFGYLSDEIIMHRNCLAPAEWMSHASHPCFVDRVFT